jgi:hypothetical protein
MGQKANKGAVCLASEIYGAFTVSESQVGKVRRYIREQEKHHRTMSFEEEFEALLKGNRIDFDEKYLWT